VKGWRLLISKVSSSSSSAAASKGGKNTKSGRRKEGRKGSRELRETREAQLCIQIREHASQSALLCSVQYKFNGKHHNES